MGRIEAQLAGIEQSNRELARQTSSVAAALRNPGVRGRWGEVQLTRIVESAGVLEGVVYRCQPGESNGRLRPDMIIDLGAGRRVVIDAKVPLAALIEAHADGGEPDSAALVAHAQAVRGRIKELAGKDYATNLAQTPDFVILFLPADDLLGTALRADAALLDHAADSGVILATPTTLMALLRVIALAWQEERAGQGAEEILTLAHEAVSRVGMLAGHLQHLGTRLDATLMAYNKVVGSWQSRIRPVARRLSEHGTQWEGISGLAALDTDLRRIDPLDDTG
jgi:DNA recombination protein RmuC